MRTNIFARTALALAFVLGGLMLSSELAYTAASSNHEYNEDNLNVAVDTQNPTFTIKLKSNPTTGYAWFLREYDSELMVPQKHHFQASDSKLMGAPGFETWTFRMKPAAFVVPRQTVVRFVYARPWQGADDAKQVVFRVTTLAKS